MRFLSIVALLLAMTLSSPGYSNELSIYWIDVEGGAATLIVTPAGESVLVDSGNPGYRDANRIAQLATQIAGLKRVDHLITTHYHRDHYGGAVALSKLLPIGTVHDNGVFDGMPDNPGKEYFELDCQSRRVIQPGDELKLQQSTTGPPCLIRCLGTRKEFIQSPDQGVDNATICAECTAKDRDGSDNANSVVLLVEFGDFRFYDGGDLTWNQEMKLICPQNLIGLVDVYQVTHHGLDSSNNPALLKSIRPRVAIMNNGDTKGCMPEVFANLSQTDSIEAIYQMHRNLRPDGSVNNTAMKLIANHRQKNACEGNYIQLTVSRDGNNYSVSIPSQNTKNKYETSSK